MTVFADRASLLLARNAWCDDRSAASETYGPIGTWNVSQITDLSYIFCGEGGGDCHTTCTTFDDDVGSWDTAAVTTLYGAFRNAHAFNRPLGTWTVSSVTRFEVRRRRAIARRATSIALAER